MKKFYLLILSVCAMSAAQAQTFTFNYNGNPLAAGATLNVAAADAEIIDLDGTYDVVIAPNISVTATMPEDTEDSFEADLTVTSLNGQQVQCCAGGDCTTGTLIKKEVTFIEGEKMTVDLQLEYMGFGLTSLESLKNIKVLVEIADQFVDTARQSLTVVMYGGEASVEVIENSRIFYAAKGGFNYNLPGEAEINLYTTAGVHCASYKLSGEGFIAVSDLPAGIYLFTAVGDGLNDSGKVAL